MANYKIGVQKTLKGEFSVVLFSADNGKLVMQGEPLKNRMDAEELAADLCKPDPVLCDIPRYAQHMVLIRATKKWPKNSGPRSTKKK